MLPILSSVVRAIFLKHKSYDELPFLEPSVLHSFRKMPSGPCRPFQLIRTLQSPQDPLPVLNHTSHSTSLSLCSVFFLRKTTPSFPPLPHHNCFGINVCRLYLKIQLHPPPRPQMLTTRQPSEDAWSQGAFSLPCSLPRPLMTASFYELFAAQKCRLRLFKPRYLNESQGSTESWPSCTRARAPAPTQTPAVRAPDPALRMRGHAAPQTDGARDCALPSASARPQLLPPRLPASLFKHRH